MFEAFGRTWSELITPILRRPKMRQVAALCYRQGQHGREVLMITSRGTGRWILPKGWPVSRLTFQKSALQEAWEEAGVKRGKITKATIGQYSYTKHLDAGFDTPCDVDVFAVEVVELSPDYPEQSERKREWMAPGKAASLVAEPELKSILQSF